MGTSVFKRVEQKYILNKEQYESLQDIINKKFNKDMYYESKIYNIYFDNDNNDMITNSIEKPIYKEKIRLRSYNSAKNKDDIVYLEMKQKYKHVVYKRRIMMTLLEYDNYINRGIIPIKDGQIMKEIDYYIKYYNVHPYICVFYDRLSYSEIEDSNIRVTFDSNLRYRLCDLGLDDNKKEKKYFDKEMYIMEVKSMNSLPIWFVDVLSKNKIYPCSFSKVGNIYMKERENKKC